MRTDKGKREVDTIYGGYDGAEAWAVWHPDYEQLTVAAPDEASAIVAAAGAWGVRWTDYGVYSRCTVYRM